MKTMSSAMIVGEHAWSHVYIKPEYGVNSYVEKFTTVVIFNIECKGF